MVGRCSEVLERVAVEPKMIRTPDLKIRSLGHTSGSGWKRKWLRLNSMSALPSTTDIKITALCPQVVL
jgi:hypothetical protein